MKSRYDFMIDGSVKDSVTGNYYPDPLSLNYLTLSISSGGIKRMNNLSDNDILFLWERVSQYYGEPEWDDIVLTVNNIPHINLLKAGEDLILPSEGSIIRSYQKETSL